MNYLVYLSYPILLLIFLAGSKWYKRGEWNESFTSLTQFKYIQGFMAICIMMHHIAQETCADWQPYPLIPGLEFFVRIGYYFVAVFMFSSGYGLFISYKKKPDYFKGFFNKRVLPVILGLFGSSFLFIFARIILGEPMNGHKWFMYITTIGMPNIYSWFAVAMPFFYLFFYLSFRYIKSDAGKITGVIAGVFLYSIICSYAGHEGRWFCGEWWYNCVHLYWIGMIFACNEERITHSFKKHYPIWLLAAVFMAVGFYYISEFTQDTVSYYGEYNPMLSIHAIVRNRWICLLTQMIASAGFVLLVLLITMKVEIGNCMLKFMGTITFEFYLVHGLFLELFSYRFCDQLPSIVRITNVPLLIIVVFSLSVPTAVLMKRVNGFIQNKMSKN